MKKSILIAVLVLLLSGSVVPVAFASGGSYHTVHYGDTLFSIGRYYGVNPYNIAKANHLHNPDFIYAGQVLYIPYYNSYPKPHHSNYHVVQRGENLSSIGYAYGVSAWAIAKHNNIYNLNRIYAGQVLYIPMGY